MKRIIIFTVISLCLSIHISADDIITNVNDDNYVDYYNGEGETVTGHGIIYVLNRNGTATAIGSPTSETGYYRDSKTDLFNNKGTDYHLPTTHEFKNYLDSCGGIFNFPETIVFDGKKFTLTTIVQVKKTTLNRANSSYAWEYNGIDHITIVVPKTVTVIDHYGLNSPCIDNIVLSNNIRILGSGAFNPGIKNITILETGDSLIKDSCLILPNNLKEIGDYAFLSCPLFNKVQANQNLEKIGNFAFRNTNLTSFDFPEKVTTIESGTFAECKRLRKVNLNNVTTIKGSYSTSYYISRNKRDTSYVKGAFYNCVLLNNINLSHITALGPSSFAMCAKLENADIREVETIGAGAFSGCKNLNKIYMPKVTNINESAFRNCSNLVIDLSNVEVIGNDAFFGCHLGDADLGNTNYIGERAFYNCADLEIYNLSNVNYIGSQAFSGCRNLKNVDLQSIKYVGNYAFEKTGIKELFIPKSTAFGTSPFIGCNITKITFEEGRDSIPNNFLWGTKLDSIVIPEGVTYIGSEALYSADDTRYFFTTLFPQYNINIVILPSTIQTLDTGILGPVIIKNTKTWYYQSTKINRLVVLAVTPPKFLDYVDYTNPLGAEAGQLIYVPDESVWAYKNSPGWKEYFFLPISQLTGIKGVTIDEEAKQEADDGIYYDLQGRRVTNPQKGVYIHQGKKVMVK